MKHKSDNRKPLQFDNRPSVKELVDTAAKQFEAAGIEAARQQARWLYADASGLSTAAILARYEFESDPAVNDVFFEFVRRRLAGEPLQYILGQTTFRNVSLRVDARVLIPRPETEELVSLALNMLGDRDTSRSNPSVLDVGTGSGCIAISIKVECPDASVTAIDNSPEALDVARINAEQNCIQVDNILCDIFDDSDIKKLGAFDIIVSNPPYIPVEEIEDLSPHVRDYEPRGALTPGKDSLSFYRRLVVLANEILVDRGVLLVEIHSPNAALVEAIFQQSGLTDVIKIKDLSGRERIVIGTRTPL